MAIVSTERLSTKGNSHPSKKTKAWSAAPQMVWWHGGVGLWRVLQDFPCQPAGAGLDPPIRTTPSDGQFLDSV